MEGGDVLDGFVVAVLLWQFLAGSVVDSVEGWDCAPCRRDVHFVQRRALRWKWLSLLCCSVG